MKFIATSACNQSDIDLLISASLEVAGLAGDIVELGTYKGATAFALAINHPSKRIFTCDLFGGNPYPDRQEFAHLVITEDEYKKFIVNASFFPNIIPVKGMHEITVPLLDISAISFLFMDSDHYESHAVGLEYLAPKVVKGGIIAFHDWWFEDVRKAVIYHLSEYDWDFMEGKYEYCNPDQGMAFLRRK